MIDYTPPFVLFEICLTRKKKVDSELIMTKNKNWSARVIKSSFALDLEESVFTWKDPRKIAVSLKKSAEVSTRRKTTPFQSAMSMLNFYINRAGKKLDPSQKQVLEKAKAELRNLYSKK